MKKLLASVVCLGLASLIGVASAGDKAAPKIEGVWIATAGISDGKKLPDDVLAKIMLTVTVKDGKYNVVVNGKEVETGTYKADPSKKPPTLDLTIVKGKEEGKTQLGIFKLEKEIFTVAIGAAGGKERPKNFDGGPDIEVTVMKRK